MSLPLQQFLLLKVIHSWASSGGPAALFRDAGFATFLDGILGHWVLRLRETGLDTPRAMEMS